jgi:hypothetical protein
MVEEIYSTLATTLKQKDKIWLFAILKMDELTDRWSIIISGPNLKELGKREALFKEIIAVIRSNLTPEERQNIARIGIFPLSSHLVRDVRKHPEATKFENERANGNFIHLGYVLINTPKENNLKLTL